MQIADKNKSRHDIIALAIICGVLQLALAPNIALGNGRANFALIFTCCIALLVGGKPAVLSGFFAGLFFDLSTTGPVGLMAGILSVVGYFMGSEGRNRIVGDAGASVLEVSVYTLIVSVVYHLFMLVVGDASSLLDVLFLRSLPTAALTILFFLPFAWYYSRQSASGPSLSAGGRGRHARRGRGSRFNTKGLS
ncbi:MAG: rod shape-determining protein MreD [Tractidigestivibacter sp.]|jgi:rod shape-determining protein MreD|uniref:rod shape-determining protein MreD n=1 Tax=Tractidigestivibacter sp. TaxID=2847320 RepID=UPI003D8A2814